MAEEKKKSVKKKSSFSDPATEGKELVIVESPAKAKTLNKYLGPDYVVMASVGHVRDLPGKNPKGVKDPVPGVDLERDFKPSYEIIKGKTATVTHLRQAAKKAGGIWLATDMDREGEAIAWHLAEALKIPSEKAKRVVFNAITRSEIQKAFQNPRKIDMDKVNAQQARRVLDRIVGYQVSPLLWKKVAGGLSAGRVQSVAVRLVVEREREIEAFVPEEYWKILGYFTLRPENAPALAQSWAAWLAEHPMRSARKSNGPTATEKNLWLSEHSSFPADLVEVDGKKFEAGDADTALRIAERAGFVLDERVETENPGAKGPARHGVRLKGRLDGGPRWEVKSVQTKRTKSRPYGPFITSTLQQAAANQLDFSAQLTMSTAQSLYEGVTVQGMGSVGLITYMRTDSTHISGEALRMVRDYIAAKFGEAYVPPKPNIFASSNKSAQEAHEAIRPTDVNLTPELVRPSLKEEHYKLYKLIWERFVACQMTDAQWDATTVLVSGKDAEGELVFRSSGRVLVFDGYYKVAGMPGGESEEALLPPMKKAQAVAPFQIDPTQNFTSPPPRYTEASLVKKLEAEGIGRPSTYAQIIQVIQNRKYVEKIKNRFYATDLGKVVTDKLVEAFPEIMQVGYTRDMEQQLDDIEEKHADWVEMLHQFYGPFKRNLESAYDVLGHARAETQPASYRCPQCGGETVYRFGRKGRFLSCANYPECKFAAPVDRDGRPLSPEQTDIACPLCGAAMMQRKGRFGPFLSCARYPDCVGIVNLDKKGFISTPKVPPLPTGLQCPKCRAPMNLRRGSRGPWLSCSSFPKCRGRVGWTTLDKETKARYEKALEDHEKAHPQPVIRKRDGSVVDETYRPEVRDTEASKNKEELDASGH